MAQAVTYVPPGGRGGLCPVLFGQIDHKRVEDVVFLCQISAQLVHSSHSLSWPIVAGGGSPELGRPDPAGGHPEETEAKGGWSQVEIPSTCPGENVAGMV